MSKNQRARKISVEDKVKLYLSRIKKDNKKINAFLEVRDEKPVGLQVMCAKNDESKMLSIASEIEKFAK